MERFTKMSFHIDVVFKIMCILMCFKYCRAVVSTETPGTLEGHLECAKGHFICPNNSVCMPNDKNCDKVEDCPDGTDEQNCDDPYGNLYWDHLFRKRPAAEHDDDLEATCSFQYNGPCTCLGKNIICQHKGFVVPPDDLPSSPVNLLDFTGNSFRNLTENIFSNIPEINTLVLKDCKVQIISKGSFQFHPSLETLYLDNNFIQYIPENVFPKNSSLKTLILSRNKLVSLAQKAFEELTKLEELDLRDNKLTDFEIQCLQPLVKLKTLYLNGNHLQLKSYYDSFTSLPLTTLSLANNEITFIEPCTFCGLEDLQYLYLSGNKITHLNNGTFENLYSLVALNLNDNMLQKFESGVFVPLQNITSLYLKNNLFKTIDDNLLEPMKNLEHIYFSRFSLCLAARHIRNCEPRSDGISSRDHLLDSAVLRGTVWLMGIVGFAGNMLVLLGRRLLARDTNAVHSIYIRNLALSDLLMGLYLFIIADADRRYRGNYLFYEYNWRHSVICNFCGVLSTVSCQSSACILSLVTWDRLVSVTKPLTRRQPSSKKAAALLISVWLLATAVAVTPIIGVAEVYFGDEFYGNNGVCLSLHIHEPYAQGWQYSAVMFVALNAAALSFICYAYYRMFHEIKSSGVALRSTQESQERVVAQRFGIIILTDCMCWVPIIIVKLVALSGIKVSEAIYAWLAILVLPINSALNPVIYTLTTTRFKQQIFRLFASCFHKKLNEIQHSGFDSAGTLSLGIFSLRGSTRRFVSLKRTQSSLTSTKNSWKRKSTAV